MRWCPAFCAAIRARRGQKVRLYVANKAGGAIRHRSSARRPARERARSPPGTEGPAGSVTVRSGRTALFRSLAAGGGLFREHTRPAFSGGWFCTRECWACLLKSQFRAPAGGGVWRGRRRARRLSARRSFLFMADCDGGVMASGRLPRSYYHSGRYITAPVVIRTAPW